MTTEPAPFDMFTMAPRTPVEFGQALAYQLDHMPQALAIPHKYITAATNIVSPDKIIGIIYKYASPVDYMVWFDGRLDVFVIADLPSKEQSHGRQLEA